MTYNIVAISKKKGNTTCPRILSENVVRIMQYFVLFSKLCKDILFFWALPRTIVFMTS